MRTADEIELDWKQNPRWAGIKRDYAAKDVVKLRGSVHIEHSLARIGAEKFWKLLHEEPYVPALGAMTGNQAIQMVDAGLKAIYVSGWQTAADANLAGQMYPDQSLYPSNSVPILVKAINNALLRADQIQHAEDVKDKRDYIVPIVADGEAGFGGVLNVFELTKAMIEAGAACVHYEDQLASVKKCGHMGGKVLIPVSQFIRTLKATRLAADVMDVSTLIIARTDALSAKLITSNIDDEYRPNDDWDDWRTETLGVVRTKDGYYDLDVNYNERGLYRAIQRAIFYAPYADLLWFETSEPNIQEAKVFADSIHEKYPNKMLAYNLSPSFNWRAKLDRKSLVTFQSELAKYKYVWQFVTLGGFHSLNIGMFDLACRYLEDGMEGYAILQDREFAAENGEKYRAVKHQRFVGTGYFDQVSQVISGYENGTSALKGSTEESQFEGK